MKRIFKEYDVNSNNFIDKNELRNLVADLDIDFSHMKDPDQAFNDHVEYLWYKYDKNGDGYISYEEFISIHTDLIDSV